MRLCIAPGCLRDGEKFFGSPTMSAKKKKSIPSSTVAAPAVPVASAAASPTTVPPADEFRQRHPRIASAIFAALCIYVAMLWLLALDQTFHWGIFGPKIPPTP
jgi:hypothetical protein